MYPATPALTVAGRRLLSPLPWERYRLAAALGAVVIALGVVIAVERSGDHSGNLSALLILPVILAGASLGVAAGLGTALVLSVLFSMAGPASLAIDDRTPWALFTALAVVLGLLSGASASIHRTRARRLTEVIHRLDTIYGKSLRLMAETVELRDPITAGHSRRVAQNAVTLGRAVGDRDLDVLYWAGLLHDVGKIAVPESVLHKDGGLTAEEWTLMRAHVTMGATLIARNAGDFAPVAAAVRGHHERWDGSGYPGGLAGEAIPLHGRILAVVDVYEALTCDRPYRAALDGDSAMAYLRERRGQDFDPRLVDAFEDLWEAGTVVTADALHQPRLL